MKKLYPLCLLLLLVLLSLTATAQKKKADKYYSTYDYNDAIPLYVNVLKSSPNDTASIINLANSYFIIKDYSNAETYYARAAAMNGVPPKVYYNYGEVLKNNGKIPEAKTQFIKYVSLVPSDSLGTLEVKNCDRINKDYYVDYRVTPVDGINTEFSEFSPFIYKDSLVFASDRKADVTNFAKNKYTGSNYLKMYMAQPVANGYSNAKPMDANINGVNADYNIGPLSYTADGNKVFYTEVAAIRGSHFVNRMKIYYYERTGNTWGKRMSFTYNSDSYSAGHPAISADGKKLYFASDMQGGYGGTDIYVSELTADGWSKPRNLGAEVNTAGNECFPYIRNDGALFFSSDKHFNYGGLDVFSAQEVNGSWTNVHNLGADVNSADDDFGICFNKNGRSGYFSSNRKGGKGSDDIYSFLYIGDYFPLKGKLLYSFSPLDKIPNAKVKLLTKDGRVVAETETDSLGYFDFKDLQADSTYIVKVDENDPRLKDKKRIYLADKDGRVVSATRTWSPFGKYAFEKLPPDLRKMSKIEADPSNLAGNILHGDNSEPVANVKIAIVDSTGKELHSAITNEFGSFVFDDVSASQEYNFRVFLENVDLPTSSKITITDREGNVINTFYTFGNKTYYSFKLLAKDSGAIKRMAVEDSKLRVRVKDVLLSDQRKPLANVKLSLYDSAAAVTHTTTTDESGVFVFSDLPADHTYSVLLDTTDSKFAGMHKAYIADATGKILYEVKFGKNLKLRLLEEEKVKMGSMYVDDPWLAALNMKKENHAENMNIIENIYFDYNKSEVLPGAASILNKLLLVMQSNKDVTVELDAYTDPRGGDKFNLDLSQKRADAALAYMVKQGISKKRLTAKGYGKSHPLNNCGDPNVKCSEEEYAVNRRIEFKITQK